MSSIGVNTNTESRIKIGWDIGIKNMSYCRLQPHQPNTISGTTQSTQTTTSINQNIITIGLNSYQIAGWEIINVVPKVNQFIHDQGEITLDARPALKCCAPKTTKSAPKKTTVIVEQETGELCGKSATHSLVSDHTKGFCNTHFKSSVPRDATTGVQQDTIEILPDSCRCWHHDISSDGTRIRCQTGAVILNARNQFIGYCRKHIPSCGLPAGDQLKIIRSRKVASLDLTMLAAALYDELDARPDILVASDVLLENQPVLKNPTMKTMQTFLYSYYVMHGVQRPKNGARTVGDIHCYCASNKLDIIKLLPPAAATDILRRVKEVKSGYSRNKKMAVYICQYLLEHGTGCADLAIKFADKKKQDDLADSLLMTLHFFERANLTKLRTAEAKTKAKAAKSGSGATDDSNAAAILPTTDERQDLLAELLPKRGGGKKTAVPEIALTTATNTTPAEPSTTTLTDTTKNKIANSKPKLASRNTNKQTKSTNPAVNILTQLGGKLSINIDSPPVSDSSLSDAD
jgi:hypothetical protein